MKQSTLSIIQDLKNTDQDFEWYRTTSKQIQVVTNDIKEIDKDFGFSNRRYEKVKVMDIGAGDGRVLQAIEAEFENDEDLDISAYAIEKATVHTSTYRKKGITLIGTEFNQINFISKSCKIAFVNPPYSEYSHWLATLINHLNFGLLYAVIPERWVNDPAIKEAMALRGIESANILAESDFLDAERAARAKVHVVRFSFDDLNPENIRFGGGRYRPEIGRGSSDPFQLFIENELGLKKTYSETTHKFNECVERERIRKAMNTKGTKSFELVESKGVLQALLDNYELDLTNALNQYKLISNIEPQLLQELGVDYDALCKGIKEKSLGYRNVYWSLLFEKLDAISSRLTSKHKNDLLKKLSSNALDFTYTNTVYIIHYAVEIGNELIEQSLIDVFENLTSADAISHYYKSNEHVYQDNWRHTRSEKNKSKYLLDYRFIHGSWSNFGSNSWERGLNEGARCFTSDLMVAFKLLGYTKVYSDDSFEAIEAGGKLSIIGFDPDGNETELAQIKFYKNGNRHLKFNQKAMLRLNVTVSRLLGWVRSKNEFVGEVAATKPVEDDVWNVSNDMKVLPSSVLMLPSKAA